MNYAIILNTLGWVLSFEAAAFLLPIICALCYGEPYILMFLICIILCAMFGGICITVPVKRRDMYAKEGFVIVALSWIVMSIFGALPFVMSGYMHFVDALFETVSGFTTTGATVLRDVEALPKCLLFWRSFTHWIGGMGVLVFLVAILPLAGGSNFHLIRAESPGPSVSKLVPKIGTSAKLLYGMYIFLTILQIVLLLIGGMNMFESVTTAFGTAGTGGFAVKNSSMAEYSPYIQNVVTTFMILFGVDFGIYYLLLMGHFREIIRSEELKVYLGIIIAASLVICFNCVHLFDSVLTSLRHGAFQVASIITTTGFATDDFDKWPELSKTILVGLMFIGACAGSTGGGIKVSRIIILIKSFIKEIKIAVHPRRTYKLSVSGRFIEHETVRNINTFIAAYIVIYALSVLIISIDNMDFTTNFTAVAATLNNVGPGLGKVGPVCNFGDFSIMSKLVFIFDMLAGRLEIFPMLILFSAHTWKK